MSQVTTVLGIDPGAQGALVLLRASRPGDEQVLCVVDMPADIVMVNGKQRKRVSASRVATAVESMRRAHTIDAVWIEDVHSRPGEGSVGAFTFGRCLGIVEAVAHACGLRVELVSPAKWKGGIRCPADKSKARAYASKLFADHAHMFARVKDDGRAEAALIAYYGLVNGPDLTGSGKRVVW